MRGTMNTQPTNPRTPTAAAITNASVKWPVQSMTKPVSAGEMCHFQVRKPALAHQVQRQPGEHEIESVVAREMAQARAPQGTLPEDHPDCCNVRGYRMHSTLLQTDSRPWQQPRNGY